SSKFSRNKPCEKDVFENDDYGQCNEDYKRIKIKNTEANTKLFNAVEKIKRSLANVSPRIYEKIMSPVDLKFIKDSIDASNELNQEEKEGLKNIYASDDIESVLKMKETVFTHILEERNLKIARNDFIKNKLEKLDDGPPLLNIDELDSKFHDYENLALNELEAIKNDLIATIKNHRATKKLSELLSQAKTCADTEAENLQLATDDPWQNFPTAIKEHTTQEAIENQEKEAYQHILAQFKAKVKQELGAAQKDGEYSPIDDSQNFVA
ncbi:5787_t:CDS:2, partial [Cetraspora pellucida]